jgi:hypothetical protein
MSAIGPKRTSAIALHMSAFGGKADIATGGPKKDFEGLHVEAANEFVIINHNNLRFALVIAGIAACQPDLKWQCPGHDHAQTTSHLHRRAAAPAGRRQNIPATAHNRTCTGI